MDELEIIDFDPLYAADFKSLNVAWLERYFEVEPLDVAILGNPYEEILRGGGDIVFAKLNGNIVGTCALRKNDNERYELTKMAVTPQAQGQQIGKKLALAIIAKARTKGAKCIFLESNRKLVAAITLYEKLGFVERPPVKQSAYSRADIYMELMLND